jgi:hypothetical protein
MFKFKIQKNTSGFALLYAVLLTGVILAIGLGLSSILTKQIILSSIGSNSQVAYYAANTGKECVFYWGFQGGTAAGPDGTAFGGYIFDDSLNDGEGGFVFVEPTPGAQILCDDQTLDVILDTSNSTDDKKIFTVGSANGFDVYDYKDPSRKVFGCARVNVTMEKPASNNSKVVPVSIVESTGSSVACGSTNNNRRVERTIVRSGEFSKPF